MFTQMIVVEIKIKLRELVEKFGLQSNGWTKKMCEKHKYCVESYLRGYFFYTTCVNTQQCQSMIYECLYPKSICTVSP